METIPVDLNFECEKLLIKKYISNRYRMIVQMSEVSREVISIFGIYFRSTGSLQSTKTNN